MVTKIFDPHLETLWSQIMTQRQTWWKKSFFFKKKAKEKKCKFVKKLKRKVLIPQPQKETKLSDPYQKKRNSNKKKQKKTTTLETESEKKKNEKSGFTSNEITRLKRYYNPCKYKSLAFIISELLPIICSECDEDAGE